jgi:hypothetical protein
LHIATKATLDIVARAYNNAKVDEFVYLLAMLIKKGNLYEEYARKSWNQGLWCGFILGFTTALIISSK